MSLFDSEENPADMLPEGEDPMPPWMLWFLAGVFVFVVVSCGMDGYNSTMDKAVPVMTWATPGDLINGGVK